MFVGKGERVGWPIFELNKFKDQELHHLKSVDRLFVCSQWAKDVCRENGVEVPIDVVPLGYDPEVFYVDPAAKADRPYWTKDATVFINVGKWEVRKGHNELCEAFSKAFTKDDNVKLWMMNTNDFIGHQGNEKWKRKYIASDLGEKVDLLPRLNTQEQMRHVFNHVDFGVFPAHAEGWNLEILELMACGVPSIATNYSGHSEFCNDENSLLVEPKGLESAQDGVWFHGQGEWCKYSVDDLVDRMREAHQIKQEGQIAERFPGMGETLNKYTWARSAEKMVEVL
jgi:glycosyltransferase involved in cell wall biosynthesis